MVSLPDGIYVSKSFELITFLRQQMQIGILTRNQFAKCCEIFDGKASMDAVTPKPTRGSKDSIEQMVQYLWDEVYSRHSVYEDGKHLTPIEEFVKNFRRN